MSLTDMRLAIKKYLIAVPVLVAIFREINYGKIEIAIQAGKVTQVNILASERDFEKKEVVAG